MIKTSSSHACLKDENKVEKDRNFSSFESFGVANLSAVGNSIFLRESKISF